MAINQERIDTRRSYGLLAGVIIASVALGLIVWKVADLEFQSVFYTMFIVIGVYLFIASFFADAKLDFAPSDSSFYLVIGTLLTTVGALGFNFFTQYLNLAVIIGETVAKLPTVSFLYANLLTGS